MNSIAFTLRCSFIEPSDICRMLRSFHNQKNVGKAELSRAFLTERIHDDGFYSISFNFSSPSGCNCATCSCRRKIEKHIHNIIFEELKLKVDIQILPNSSNVYYNGGPKSSILLEALLGEMMEFSLEADSYSSRLGRLLKVLAYLHLYFKKNNKLEYFIEALYLLNHVTGVVKHLPENFADIQEDFLNSKIIGIEDSNTPVFISLKNFFDFLFNAKTGDLYIPVFPDQSRNDAKFIALILYKISLQFLHTETNIGLLPHVLLQCIKSNEEVHIN